MATEVEHIPGSGGRTRVDSYPWDKWLAEGKRRISRTRPDETTGKPDFLIAVTAMRAYVYRFARRRGVYVTTVLDGNDLYLHVYSDAELAAAGIPKPVPAGDTPPRGRRRRSTAAPEPVDPSTVP